MRTLASYAAYYAKWSKVWEAQALLRADAVVGDEGVRAQFTALVDPLRYPPAGISDADVVEVRRIKARVDRERLPRGADPHTHLKLGRGGLADIEWTVQLLQLRYAGSVAALRSPRTLTALDAARAADLLSDADADALDRAWRTVSRLRNAITLVTGKSGDQLPRDARERAAVASILGYGPGSLRRDGQRLPPDDPSRPGRGGPRLLGVTEPRDVLRPAAGGSDRRTSRGGAYLVTVKVRFREAREESPAYSSICPGSTTNRPRLS